ncbi:MAG: hypothetical protein FWE80_04810 [Oscillospiraceae bacterium]|nr:hypothetical protein [Oscillospiraceae bacterium]
METWAWYKDKRPLSEHLKESLIQEGFVLKERDFSEVYKKIVNTSKDKYVFKMVDLFRMRCPICGYPLKYEFNKNYGLGLYLCTNEPEVCDFMTNSKFHLHDIYKCNKCKELV